MPATVHSANHPKVKPLAEAFTNSPSQPPASILPEVVAKQDRKSFKTQESLPANPEPKPEVMPSQEPRPTEPTERAQLEKVPVSQAAGAVVTEAVSHSSQASAPPPEHAPSRADSGANKPVTKGLPYSWGKYFLLPRKPTAVPESRCQERKKLSEAPATGMGIA